MATHTVNVLPLHEAALSRITAALNANLTAAHEQAVAAAAAKNPPDPVPLEPTLWTPDSYLQARILDLLTSYAKDHQADILSAALANWPNMTQANQQLVLTDLGLTAYSGLPAAALEQVLSTIGMQAFLALPADKQTEVFGAFGIS